MSRTDLFDKLGKNDLVQRKAYRFIKKLGSGSFANVYLTEFQSVPPQIMACKVIDIMRAPSDYIKKFLPRELNILRKLNHPHIVHVFAIYEQNSKYLIFMRYAEKGDLLDFIVKSGAIAETQARIWVKQIVLAVQYLHELEIAHRDLKCENILVTANFNVKVADFGFSRLVINKRGIRTLSATYCGSPSYCAPEILKGTPYNPKISDIWSLGIVIYVMLNKSLPFDSAHVKKLYEQQISKKWRLKPNVEAVISTQVKDLLQNMIEPSIEKRYTISEVVNSEWLFMDHRLLGMSEEESLALIRAREERMKMEERIFSPKAVAFKEERTRKKIV